LHHPPNPAVARSTSRRVAGLNRDLSDIVARMAREKEDEVKTLDQLLRMSAEIELLSTSAAFRFGAAGAYEAIVNQRIEVLREERLQSRQTFGEFMMRRFDPAMRTVTSTQDQLRTMSDRALRAGNLLRTRVDVERSAQNQALLTSMDKRADLQLRLQRTVEGLSVVAISYYAVNLVLYILGPVAKAGISKITLAAITTPIVLLIVWLMMERIHKKAK